jgi:two-component system sensor histidine kinase KdpD
VNEVAGAGRVAVLAAPARPVGTRRARVVIPRRIVPGRAAIWGAVLAVALVGGLTASMLPFRSHLSVATTALVLVIPVVASVAVGGFPAGVAATVTGFVAYDLLFIPPYYTLAVGAAQNWIALAVYVVVMLVTAQVVAQVNAARAEAQRRATEVRRLFDVSELLVRDSSLPVLFQSVVTAVLGAFRLDSAALLLPVEGHLRQVA